MAHIKDPRGKRIIATSHLELRANWLSYDVTKEDIGLVRGILGDVHV